MKKPVLFIICLACSLFTGALLAQDHTAIPDPKFEQALIDMGIDTDGLNGQVLTENINTLTTLNIINKDIDSLYGIQAFVKLTSLNCSFNNLKALDVSNNTALQSLSISSNQISSISLSANLSLKSLVCASNQLDSLIVRDNDSLTVIDCSGNRLKQLDVSDNILLSSLTCSSNQLESLSLLALDSLTFLDCSNNRINELDINQNLYLGTLLCAGNQLNSLDISVNDSLTFIDCSGNQLNTLDVSNNKFLTNLTCSSNQLTSFSVTENDSLTFLSCANNQIPSLDLSNNVKLLNLICTANLLTSLDLSNNLVLSTLDISVNLLTGLSVKSNMELTSLNCSNNQLTDLDISNGQNSILELFNSTNNPNLRCIKVDDPVAANGYPGWQKDAIATYNFTCNPTTYVPDDNFEAALAPYDDIANDDFVPTANIENLTYLDISNQHISNLTGIEDFLALDTLDCSMNSLINLDMTRQEFLVYLDCSGNLLRALSLRNEPGSLLTYMDATINPFLTCIQVDDVDAANGEANWVKDITATFNLDCSAGKTYVPDDNFEQALIDLGYDYGSPDNYVPTTNISTLKNLDVAGKNIFDLTGIEDFVGLDSLDCSLNKLSSLNISNNTNLKKLSCYSNYLTELDVHSDTLLISLSCGDNKLSTLDVSKNTNLVQLVCNGNALTELDVSENSELLILNCNSNHIAGSGLDLSKNTKLVQLFCSNNKLTTIDVTANTTLEEFVCASNYLSGLNVLNNAALVKLDCSLNYLTSLDVSGNVNLTELNCNTNQLKSLNFSLNTLLRNLSCDNNQLTSLNVTSNDSLRTISASTNKLMNLNITNNQLLNELSCSGNQLSSLNVSSNDSLKILSCKNNELSDLNLTNNLLLEFLDCDYNQLTTLFPGMNILLSDLSCSDNSLTVLDVSSNVLLRFLNVDNNQLEEINLAGNTLLERLSCSGNSILTLNLNNSPQLTALNGSSNQLISASIKNGNNSQLSTFYLTDNPDLTCIEVDDTAFANSASGWTKDDIASYNLDCRYDETYVPDDHFEQALIGLGYDSGPTDDYILTNSIDTITGLDISGKSISDLTGIEGFTALRSLDISSNLLDSLDLGNNTALTTLICSSNQLDSLGLNKNTDLEVLDFASNLIAEIDLKELTSLVSLTCNSNELTCLTLMVNVNLTSLNCRSNQLTSLNIQNGTNTNITSFDATDNPDLTCIEVDDTLFSNSAPGWDKDAIASYSLDCHYNETYVPDDAFEQTLKNMGYDDSSTGPLDDYVPTARINNLTSLYISNKGISELTGIQDFVNLVTLDCKNNSLTNLDFSSNDLLEYLYCSGNQLTGINVSSNTALTRLNVADNMLTSLDVSANSNLTELRCSSNKLTAIDITQNHNLTVLSCYSNQLVSVDANNGHNDIITSFNLTDNPDLTCVLVDDPVASEGYANWLIDPWAQYRTECNDDDNDGVPDTEDLCPTTPFGKFVDLFGCSFFSLPADNFTILTTSETCRSSNNGKINITAAEIYNYNARIIGGIVNDTINFTNAVEIRNLRAGTYELCLTIDDIPGYLNCCEIVITEPEDLSVLSSFNPEDETIVLHMSGGTNYTIDFNGLIFTTQAHSIALNLDKGENTITVKADAECQGIYEETIFLSDKVVFYPNPFEDYFNVFIGGYDLKEVQINIYSCLGNLILSKDYPVLNGSVSVDASHLAAGIYIVSVKSDTSGTTFKIVKK